MTNLLLSLSGEELTYLEMMKASDESLVDTLFRVLNPDARKKHQEADSAAAKTGGLNVVHYRLVFTLHPC